jgi:hypothetical protein
MLEGETPEKFNSLTKMCLLNSLFYDIFEFFCLINDELPTFTSVCATLDEGLITLDVERKDKKRR